MNKKTTKGELKIQDEHLKEFIKNYEFILNNYYEDVNEDDLINGAIEGMMGVLDDPYSIYMMGDEYNNLNISLNGSYNGLGISVAKNASNNLIVMGIFENSPAHEAGVKVGDIILSINDKDTASLSSADFSKIVLNSNDKDFKLKISRNNEEIELVVGKSNVSLRSVEAKVIESEGHKIGYIYVSIFAANTYQQFKDGLSTLEDTGIDSLIIDLRSNTGGHLSSAEAISSLFVDSSHVIYQLVYNNKTEKIKSSGTKNREYPIVLLANSYTASASELLIGCLKDNLNAKLVGTKTYGKGTVQELVTLSSGDQYKITTKKWLTAGGEWINERGIEPDIEVTLSEEYYLNPSDETDNQLNTAINYIKGNI